MAQEKKSKFALKKSLTYYKSAAGYDVNINKHFKENKTCDGLPKKEKEICDNLYHFISNSVLEKDILVYRGVSNVLPLKEYIDSKDGKNSNIFLSTSLSLSIARSFAKSHSSSTKENPYILKILLPKGTHAINIDELNLSSNIHEEEILVLPGGILQFTGHIECEDDIPIINFIYIETNFSFGTKRKKSIKRTTTKSKKRTKTKSKKRTTTKSKKRTRTKSRKRNRY